MMTGNRNLRIAAGIGAATLLAIPVLAQRAPTSGPIARYDMRAGTVSGFGAMGAGGMGSAMSMMFGGGGGGAQHELHLRLGSSRAADKGTPRADHFMPPVAKLGKSVALIAPKLEKAPEELPQKPKGRLLIFWGCGEHAPKGQPVVLDFARVAAGQIPAGMPASTVVRDWGPTIANSRTFGRWPAEDDKYVKPESSLIGAHRIAGNYSPEISFTLTRDFMAPLKAKNAPQASGSALVSWSGIADATGYFLTLSGGKMGPNEEIGDLVMWSSSASKAFGGGLTDWLTPAQVAAFIKDRTVLPPTATSCTVPVEVRNASPDFRMGMMEAYGPMEDFAFPPRPADPKLAWNLEWTARVRHRSTTSWMDMPGMEGMDMGMSDEGGATQSQQPQQQKCKPKGGLGGLLGGVLKPGGC